MENIRDIKARIRSVSSTQQITKTMKMVSVSKLRRVQSKMESTRPFAEMSHSIISTLLSGSTDLSDCPLAAPRQNIRSVCYVMFVGNRGLCGIYNTALLHFMQELAAKETRDFSIIVCGRWGRELIRKSGLPILRTFSHLSDTPNADEAHDIAELLKHFYTQGEFDEINLVYQSYASALRQEPVVKTLLPAAPKTSETVPKTAEPLFFPDKKSVIDSILELYINSEIFSVMTEARCGEHTARMTAMSAASDSTDEMISKLEITLNRARQAAITTEISEIVGGASALKNKKD